MISVTKSFTEKIAKKYFIDIINALNYLQSQGISHGDLRPDNIVFTEDFTLKLTDIGLKPEDTIIRLPYLAPEIKGAKPSDDVFAAGCILLYMIFGK